MTRRVVITGIGIVSSIGNSQSEVLASLKAGKSGISFAPEYAEMGFRSHVHGKPDINLQENIDKRLWRFMGDASGYVHLCMEQAIKDSGLNNPIFPMNAQALSLAPAGPPRARRSPRPISPAKKVQSALARLLCPRPCAPPLRPLPPQTSRLKA